MSRKIEKTLFIGSSVESLPIANAIQSILEFNINSIIWNQGIFKPSEFALESLTNQLNNFDYAIFIFSPEDIALIRDSIHYVTRDNVIFELGLFVGRISRTKCFIIKPRGIENFHLPTDLLGLTACEYDSSNRNLFASLNPACTRIINRINEIETI